MPQRLKLSFDSLRIFVKVSLPYFRSEKRKVAWSLLAALFAMLILVSVVNVFQSYVARDFINALSERREDDFIHQAGLYCLALLMGTALAVSYRYTEERLALSWREWMTGTLVHRYLNSRNYYRLLSQRDIDNPDQRIAEDVKNFTATTLSLALIILNSVITMLAFVGVLASISWKLVIALILYTIAGTFFTLRIGKKLVRIYNRQYAREANFRYGLVRIRDNAESIAFFRGERREKLDLGRRFRDLVRNSKFLISWNRNLGFFTVGYNNLSLILPTLVIAPTFLRGEIPFGVVTQSAGAFAQVLAASSILISQFERISAYIAGVSRLDALWNAVAYSIDDDEPEIRVAEGEKLRLSRLTVRPPSSTRELVRELDMTLVPGKGVLIMGPSGSGKSSILRTVAGLWNAGQGSIQRPNHRDMMFLPQKPYMLNGTLRAQLLYPFRERPDYDQQLSKILTKVNLEEILKRSDGSLDARYDWSNVLSLGEQQRVSFARLFFSEPSVAFLDEATSALDEENERKLYSILRESSISFVSVGHRSSLMEFHDYLLLLDGLGGWEFRSLRPSAAKLVISP